MMRRLILIVVLLTATGIRAAEVSRVLRTFDFEERRLGNVEDLPMNWVKVRGPGLPHYNNGRLSRERAHGGRYSFQFDIDGGSLAYSYGSGQIPVMRGAHYRIEGSCQTTILRNARARITAFFADQDGHPLTQSIRHSELYAAAREDQPWKQLSVELSPDQPNAAWLVIQLELLQPMQYQGSSLGQRALFSQDVRGSAWFDDITVSQVPHVILGTRRAGNIFRAGQLAQLDVTLSDSFTQDLVAQIAVNDAEGRLIYQRSGALQISTDGDDPANVHSMVPLPELHPGWYRAAISMSSRGQQLGTRTLDLVILPEGIPTTTPDPRFGIDATGLSFAQWGALPQILPILSAGHVKLAVWSAQGDVERMAAADFDSVLDQLQRQGIAPTACLLDVPPNLSAKWSAKSWEGLLRADSREWRDQLSYLVSRHAMQLDRWQIGADGSDAFVINPKMREVYATIQRELSGLLQTPDLAMPWQAWYELDGQLPTTLALSIPTAILPEQLPLYMQDASKHKGHNLSLSIEPLDQTKYGRLTQFRDFARRVVYALSADARRLDFPLPYTISDEQSPGTPQPSELLMIIRTLTATLGDTTFKGKVPIAPDVDAFLFDRHGEGILALWNRGTISETKELALNLGQRPAMVDLWGNVTALPHVAGDKSFGNVRLKIGPMPIFLIDIDGPQAQLRASVAIDQPLMESSLRPHQRKIRFTNPYPQAIGGILVLHPPAGWTLTPATIPFNVNSGQTLEREVQITFPYNSVAGPKLLDCVFDVQGEAGSTFEVPIEMRLALLDVGMQCIAVRNDRDVMVQQTITNYSEHPVSYNAYARYPGEAPMDHLVFDLGAGQTTVRRYVFKNVKVSEGTKVRVWIKEFDGNRILNLEEPVQ